MVNPAFALCVGLLLLQPAQQSKQDLPPTSVTIEVKDGYRFITSNGIPNHETGQFPGPGNPNTISAQSYKLRVPEHPKAADKSTDISRQPFGVALNGVVFDPGTAEFWNDDPGSGWRYEAIPPEGVATVKRGLGIDKSHAHVQPNGAYHYHALPTGMVEKIAADKGVKYGEQMLLLGWAADGFPIYDGHGYRKADDAKSEVFHLRSGYHVKKGERPGTDASSPGPGGSYDGKFTQDWEYIAGSGDLDECNGRTGVTPEFPQGTYYYVITDAFPYVPRMCKGTPDASFERHGPPPGGRGGPGRGGRPPRPPG